MVADLPVPVIEVGATTLELDVRFTKTNATETTKLDETTATTTLEQSTSKEHTSSSSSTLEFVCEGLVYQRNKCRSKCRAERRARRGKKYRQRITFGVEASSTQTYNFSTSNTSAQAARNAHEESLTTSKQVAAGETVNREVAGASINATITLQNASDLAYTIQNLQVSVFMQDPQDPTKISPVATLVPESEPAPGYALSPQGFSPSRGPFVFKSINVFPNLVESLMKNPTGLIYQISNYDINDELGRNFAYTSQDIADRTGALIIDNGSFDADGDGQGDLAEHNRIAVGSGRVIDQNGNGRVDATDQRVVFDSDGKQVGVTLRDALRSLGLKRYVEPLKEGTERELDLADRHPALYAGLKEAELKNIIRKSTDLTLDEQENSYSVVFTDEGRERVSAYVERRSEIRMWAKMSTRRSQRLGKCSHRWELIARCQSTSL